MGAKGLLSGGEGHCLCGAVRFAFDGVPNWQAHCHCDSCRRNCAAPFTSYFGVSHGHWRWTGALPATYASSPGARRHFCATCGTPMAFEGAPWPDEIHFYAAGLTDPSQFRPTLHVHWNEHLPWLSIADGLPRHRSPRRLGPDADFGPLVGFLQANFAFMADRIDPPSSATRLSARDMARQTDEIWVLDEDARQLAAAVILGPRADHLYVGKLAVDPALRGQGLARQLIAHAEARARDLGLPELRLQVRVELTENHNVYAALGFAEIARTAHPGYDRPTSLTFARKVNL